SGGYPDSYKKGFEISGLADVPEGTVVFHAGTRRKDDKIVTDGGRVLGITAVVESNDIRAAKEKAYQALKKINFEGLYYRTDISDKALQ
ncbi:MAG: phosphoribosylglycinamide synthetase C domain-containing protein, partial [Methanococcaceae archaeon]